MGRIGLIHDDGSLCILIVALIDGGNIGLQLALVGVVLNVIFHRNALASTGRRVRIAS